MSTMTISKVTVAISAVVLMAVSGGAGYWYGSNHPTTSAIAATRGAGFAGGAGRGQGGFGARGGQGGGLVTGQVLSKDQGTMTVQLRDGSSKLVIVTASTKATHMTDATMDDVKQGSQVTVMGMANADGSVTAQNVQVRPDMPAGSATSTR